MFPCLVNSVLLSEETQNYTEICVTVKDPLLNSPTQADEASLDSSTGCIVCTETDEEQIQSEMVWTGRVTSISLHANTL